jgi:UDP-N-acetyl-D-mannosaminuronic acid dehydrogenase
MLLAVSRVNESVPLFLVEGMKRRLGGLSGKKVAVLGLAFKANTDDERDSLSHKLIRLLERELADVAIHDPVVATPTQGFDEAVQGADAVVIATNHSAFCGPDRLRDLAAAAGDDALLVDPWNCFEIQQVFSYTGEAARWRAPKPLRLRPRPPDRKSHGCMQWRPVGARQL